MCSSKILSRTSVYCEDCKHYKWDGNLSGHCGLYSAACITAQAQGKDPTNFTPYSDSDILEGQKEEQNVFRKSR